MIPTKEDIQARYLRGEINYDAYMKLLGRSDQEHRRNAEEEQKRRERESIQQLRNKYTSSDAYAQRAAKNSPAPNPYSYYGKKK